MSPRRLKVDQALAALPESEDLFPLRDALIGASWEDAERAWTAAEAYATVDTRLVDPTALEAQVSRIAERVRARVEAVLRHSVRALRAVEAGDHAAAARALVEAGEVEEGEQRLDEAERWYRKALELGRKPRDRRAEGLALRRLARVAREKGELERALKLYREGLAVAEAARDAEGAVVASQGVGNVHVDRGVWEEAERWYRRGLELLGDETPSRLLWQLYNNLAVVTRRAGRLEESHAWLSRAEEVVGVLGDGEARIHLENGRARLLAEQGELAEAEAAYRRALSGESPPSLRGAVLVNLAECLLLLGRLREAEEALRDAERLAVAGRLPSLLPHVYRGLGAVARRRGDGEGFLFYEQALDLCARTNVPAVEEAATQHEYALFEAEAGRLDSGAARLREAREIYERLGARPELERVAAELASIEERRGEPDGRPVGPSQ